MVLCEFFAKHDFFATWGLLLLLGSLSIMLSSGLTFYFYYVKPSYEIWRWKTNPKFPSPEMVRLEIWKTLKGVVTATFCPALSIYLASKGYSKAYCDIEDFEYEFKVFMMLWIITDFYEFFYHYCGHRFERLWENHKSHHKFFNPSPFAVIADDFIDQIVRSAPLLLFPVLFPVNMDLMFAQWGLLFYMYGTYLHWGYESHYISAHNKLLNTAYDHHLHHAKSGAKKPVRTGFFFKIWDELFGSTYVGECFCVRCQHAKGQRTLEEFKMINIPDYSVLLDPRFWFKSNYE